MNIIKRIKLAYWAFKNPDNLTMLKFEFVRDWKEMNSNGKYPLASERAMWYLHYLTFKV